MKVIWFNNEKNIYDINYVPTDRFTLSKAKLIINGNCLETSISVNQYFNYIKGYDLIQNIFTDNLDMINFLNTNNNNNYKKYKKLVNKVQIL